MRTLSKVLPLALSLASLFAAVAWTDEPVVGKLVDRQPVVEATPPGTAISPVGEIRRGTTVETHKAAGALIAVGTAPPLRGMVKLGPETRVTFKQWVVDLATGKNQEAGFFVQIGSFLAAFTPRPKGGAHTPMVEPGVEKWIETPTVRRIRLEGTLVYLQVAADGGTSIFVLEGAATVESAAGGTVHLTAGTRTEVRPGQPPTPPSPGNPATATLSPNASGLPADGLADLPRLDLRELQLDLRRFNHR